MNAPRPGECITCGDSASPLRVLEVDPERETASCAGDDGETCTVDVGLLAEVSRGDVLLVHAGAALAKLDASAPGGA
jgi:hydrogenase maturation factor